MFGKFGRTASIISALLGLAVAALVIGSNVYYGATCEQTVYQTLPAPDGKKDAVVFANRCKGDTALEVQAKIAPVRGFLVLRLPDPFLQMTAVADGGTGVVQMRWLDADTLRVAIAPQAKVYRQEPESDSVKVVYE